MVATLKEARVDIVQLAELVDRRIATIRKWERDGVLPAHLLPVRDTRKRRYWTEEQVQEIKAWVSGRFPGSALNGYKPSQKRVKQAIEKMRRTEPGEEK